MAYLFEMKSRSSSNGEPVLPKILKKTMQKDYKMKEMEDIRFFLLPLLEHVFDDTCVCAIIHSLQLLLAELVKVHLELVKALLEHVKIFNAALSFNKF